MSTSQPTICHLLRIPRELRDEIYEFCLRSDEGYHHHAETNTLRYLDGTAIDLALLSTCKQVAAEAAESTLNKNTITFKTHIARVAGVQGFFEPSLTSMACYFNSLLRRLDESKLQAACGAFSTYGTKELAKHISERYPQSGISAQLHWILRMKGPYRNSLPRATVVRLTELSHIDRQALRDALQYICHHFGLPKWLRSWNLIKWPSYIRCYINHPRSDPALRHVHRSAFEIASSTISSTEWEPWVTPTAVQIKEMGDLFAFLTTNGGQRAVYLNHRKELRYYESAASQSIRFLRMLPHAQRSRLRHLVIREDRKSSALPRCHAHGLIPYLKDLPQLRVIHRVDMWSAIFLNSNAIMNWVNAFRLPSLAGRPNCMLSCAAYKTIDWINEAMDLRHAGMPLPAYSLHLEANFDTAQRVWNAIKSLAALALANQRRHHKIEDSAAIFNKTTLDNHEVDFSGHQERRFVTSVRLILSGDPTVRLPCPIGTLEEFEEEAQRIGNELKDQPTDAWKRYAKSVVEGYLDTEDYDFTALEELYYDPFLE